MKKIRAAIIVVLLLAGCEDDVREEKIGGAVVEYHEDCISVRFE